MRMIRQPAILYPLLALAILGWWALAFHKSLMPASSIPLPVISTHTPSDLPDVPNLSPLKRETLHKALAGDFTLIAKLIREWDIDAHILETFGIKNLRHLSYNDLLQSQILNRELKNRKENPSSRPRYLPQTFASASILLALLNPDQIVALPNGLRKQTQLFPIELTSRITLNIDRYNSELLYLAHPEAAFISAHYSHPAMIDALQNQGIRLIPSNGVENLKDIKESLLQIGQAVDKPAEAELMALFIESALMAIENRLIALESIGNGRKDDQTLYLTLYSQYFLPTPASVTWELLERLGIQPKGPSASMCGIPLDQEHLLKLDPDNLIISSSHVEELLRQLEQHPSLSQLKAVRGKKIFIVDEEVQQSPTQYIVLAYYDIARSLALAQSYPP